MESIISASESELLKIEKGNRQIVFNGEADLFLPFRFQVTNVLKAKKCWSAIVGANNGPDAADREAQATMIITNRLGPTAIRHVMDQTSAKGIWAQLESIYASSAASNVYFLYKKLFAMKHWPTEGESVRAFISRVQENVSRLKSLEQDLSEPLIVMIILGGLDSTYDIVRSTVESWPNTDLTVEKVSVRLASEERIIESQFDRELRLGADEKSMHVKEKGKYVDKPCFYCHEDGHMIKDCVKRKAADNKKKGKGTTSHVKEIAF